MTRDLPPAPAPKWVELIRVRASAQVLQPALPGLEAEVAALGAGGEVEAMLLEHALYGGDLAVVLVWRTQGPAQESRTGLLLADQLRTLGSVDHAVWTPRRPASLPPHP